MAVFLLPKRTPSQLKTLTSRALKEAWQDFQLSRQAMNVTPATLEHYRYTARVFLAWVEARGVTAPDQITAKHVREFLASLAQAGKADNTLHDNARGIKTLLRFWNAEGYMPEPVKITMPKVGAKRLPVLDADELARVIASCDIPRDRALVMLLADTGLRRAEVIALDWADVDFSSGLVRVKRGKGNKARSSVISPTTRRALLKYRRTLGDPRPDSPLFRSRTARRFTGPGMTLIFRRLSQKTGLKITAHTLRRTFATLSLRAGIDPLHLQALLGHASLDMVNKYAAMIDDDLLTSHRAYSPIENLERLKGGPG